MLVPLVVAALFLLGPRAWAFAVLAVVALAAWEWGRLVALGNVVTALFVAALVVAGVVLEGAGAKAAGAGLAPGVVYAACGAAALFWVAVAPRWLAAHWRTTGRWWTLVVGFVVLLATWVALVELRAHSPWLVLAAMAVVWIADTAAYFTGRAFGRRKLAPAISPGKSWEGVWGGLAAVAAYALVLALVAPAPVVPAPLAGFALVAFVAVAVLLAGISVLGDLFESLLKRQAGVKDSGRLLPGHGGVLDRVDALLAAMPLAALAVTAWRSAA